MSKIFSEIELIEFNEKMLGRGMPIQDDGIGYNKADYGACALYYYGLSNAQYADLAKRLVKYSKTQLGIDKKDMEDTFKHYTSLSLGEDRKRGISVKIEVDAVMLSFKYDVQLIDAVRKLPSRRYDKERKNWIIPITDANEALLTLEKAGADVRNAIKYIESFKAKNNLKMGAV